MHLLQIETQSAGIWRLRTRLRAWLGWVYIDTCDYCGVGGWLWHLPTWRAFLLISLKPFTTAGVIYLTLTSWGPFELEHVRDKKRVKKEYLAAVRGIYA